MTSMVINRPFLCFDIIFLHDFEMSQPMFDPLLTELDGEEPVNNKVPMSSFTSEAA